MSKAPQVPYKHPSAVKNGAVSFASELETGESLAGTPTITSSPSGLTIDNVRINTSEITVDGRSVPIGRAVQFRVSGGEANKTYQLTVTCGTDSSPAQTLIAELSLKVIDF